MNKNTTVNLNCLDENFKLDVNLITKEEVQCLEGGSLERLFDKLTSLSFKNALSTNDIIPGVTTSMRCSNKVINTNIRLVIDELDTRGLEGEELSEKPMVFVV